ncbi:hypothetical protein [Mucilaginibacter sp. KACC 22063]|uniref:hypothetical protein n=1 Tax=Mucilaginibacter sp. KACC 22063 TaxID=3025666 RepID=UPI002365F62C|nr:hypothetical protein [Mucilaginibacter sp. KACC 22063]WDF57395.1 hypothetical protein PQ461_10040 [Mucilaginibacter sp. KACC 22063]
MFKQFTENINGNQGYLLFSLGIFLIFFIVVTFMLFKLRAQYVDYMSEIPLNDAIDETSQNVQP